VAIIINLEMILETKMMTLAELSNRINISLSALSLLNKGNIKWLRFSTLDLISSELNCQPGDIIKFISNKK